jgi:hypothetical protein
MRQYIAGSKPTKHEHKSFTAVKKCHADKEFCRNKAKNADIMKDY